MNERVERLDRSMDFIIVFLSIMPAVIFQYVSSLPYPESEPAIFEFFMKFSMRLLFLPILLIIPAWLALNVMRNEDVRIVLRIFTWTLASATMALNTIILIVLSFPSQFRLEHPINRLYAAITVIVIYCLGIILQVTVLRSYHRAALGSTTVRAFFLRKRYQIASGLSYGVPYIVLLLIIWSSIQS